MSIRLIEQHTANNLTKCTQPSFTAAHNTTDASVNIVSLCPLASLHKGQIFWLNKINTMDKHQYSQHSYTLKPPELRFHRTSEV